MQHSAHLVSHKTISSGLLGFFYFGRRHVAGPTSPGPPDGLRLKTVNQRRHSMTSMCYYLSLLGMFVDDRNPSSPTFHRRSLFTPHANHMQHAQTNVVL